MNKFLIKLPNDSVYISILLVPILAIFSIFLLEVALLFVTARFLYKIYQDKEFFYFNNFFFKFFSIFYLYVLLNYIIQIDKIDTLSVIFYFRYILYTLAIFFFLDKNKNLFHDFIKIVFLCIFILSIDALIQTIFGYNLVGLKLVEANRSSSFFGNELILGSYIFRILPFIFILLFFKQDNLPKSIKLILVILAFVTIFLSGERVSLLLSLFLLLMYLFLLKDNKIIKISKYFITILLIIFSVFLFFSKKYQHRYIFEPLNDLSNNYKVTKDLLKGYSHEPKIIFFSGLHHNLMVTSLRIFNDNKIFGSGPRSYRNICKKYQINKYSCDTHPHNYYLQLLSETGLIGIFFLIIIYVFLIKEIFFLRKNKKNENLELKICIIGFYLAALWPLIPSGNFFNNWLSIMTYLPFSFYLYLNRKSNYD